MNAPSCDPAHGSRVPRDEHPGGAAASPPAVQNRHRCPPARRRRPRSRATARTRPHRRGFHHPRGRPAAEDRQRRGDRRARAGGARG